MLEERLAAPTALAARSSAGLSRAAARKPSAPRSGVHLRKGNDIFSGLIPRPGGPSRFGELMLDTTRTYFGSIKGPMRGRDGNCAPRSSAGRHARHDLPFGSMISYVTGMLLGRRLQGRLGDSVGAARSGMAALPQVPFMKAQPCAVERLPLVIALANNQYALLTPKSRHSPAPI